MSYFSELLPKINDIPKSYIKNFEDDLKVALELFDKIEEECKHGKSKAREKTQRGKDTTIALQSINEVEDEPVDNHVFKKPETISISSNSSGGKSDGTKRRASKKRSKNEVDGISSPEVDKRQKRNASVKAQSIISKQVNVNLTQKLRRENSNGKDKSDPPSVTKLKTEEKENVEPNMQPVANIKQEKISLPPEPDQMETGSLPLNVEIKTESNKDDIAMPPPAAPVPKPRKNLPKEKPQPVTDSDEETSSKRQPRTKKNTQTVTAAPPTRSSARVRHTETEETIQPEPRPKRTRAKKKVSDAAKETETTQSSQESAPTSPAEKPRPKRTRRAQKAAEKEQQKDPEPKEDTPSEVTSPILQKDTKKHEITTENLTKNDATVAVTKMTQKELKKYQNDNTEDILTTKNVEKTKTKNTDKVLTKTKSAEEIVKTKNGELPKIKVEEAKSNAKSAKKDEILNETHVISNGIEMDKTMVIPNGVYNHAPDSPKNNRNMNETVVIERNDQTIVIDKPNNIAMDATVVLDKGPKANLTEDDSLLTDDSDSPEPQTPVKQISSQQPSSAVKEKVQQFEEMASRVTRTKTRAMAKKDDEPETQTPPDKVIKNVLSTDTLTKMNNMIFNGKPPQVSSSASKIQVPTHKHSTSVQSSASKLSYNRQREEDIKREDARRKKEAMLEAKRELQKKKREEKMAAAAAARHAAQQERKMAEEAAAKERREKQHLLDISKIARLKLIEQKKAELARKVAVTEERRKLEEQARLQRLQEEQTRALQHRNNQLLEHQAMKREEARMAKEIEKKQREYIEKQKKQREDKLHTPFKTPSTPLRVAIEPVYMCDGFQFLNSDEEAEPVDRPIPAWSTSKARKTQLMIQSNITPAHIDRLFSVAVYSPDLTEIFPGIERARLKRTSSAVWRTPPKLTTVAE